MSKLNEPVWPPILPTARAAVYCSVSRWALARAAARGELQPAGRRGRTLTWRREELDRWMTGAIASAPDQPRADPVRASSESSSDALARIARIARGTR